MQERSNIFQQKQSKPHITEDEKRTHVKNWSNSGLSKNAYSRQHQIAPSTFIQWTQLYSKPKSNFKPVALESKPAKAKPKDSFDSVLEIITMSNLKIRFSNMADVSLIVSLVEGLSECN